MRYRKQSRGYIYTYLRIRLYYESHTVEGEIYNTGFPLCKLLWKNKEILYIPPIMAFKYNDTLKGILLSAAGFSLFAVGDAVFKYLTSYYTSFQLVFFSSVFVLLTLLILSPNLGGIRATLKTTYLKFHLLKGLLFSVQMVLFLYGIAHMSLPKVYSLIFIAPFITALLSIPLLKEKISWQNWLAILLGFSGVLVILRPGLIPIDVASLAVMGSALLFSIANIITRYIGDGETMLAWGLYPELVIFFVSFFMVLNDFTVPTLPHIGLFAFIGFLSALGLISIALSFAKAPAAIVAPFHYVQMIWGILLGYVIFHETLDLWTGTGASIIILSGIWMVRNEYKT